MANLVEKLVEYAGGTVVVPPPRVEPVRRERFYTVISVDDHLLEPPDVFAGRLPARFADDAPRVVRGEDGADYWVIEGERFPLLGADALVTWEPGQKYLGPISFDRVRRATWDIHERVRDMDTAGVAASLAFPSAPFGFAGQRFARMRDRELGLAALRAYNDWVIEGWAGPYPQRVIPCQVPWLADPVVAAAEVERNAARGFTAVTFTENPEKLGLPSLYSGEWDRFFAACAATGTVINLHVGSSSETLVPSVDSPPEVLGLLFTVNAFAACVDWLYAKVAVRFPDIRIALSESGIGWVPMLLDKLEYVSRMGPMWDEPSISPVEVLRRNFWFSSYFDPRSLRLLDEIGPDRVMVESDYPHYDSSWPDTQAILRSQLDGMDPDTIDRLTHRTAADLYRHPVPTGWTTD